MVKAICNHVAVIDEGKLLVKGGLEELYSESSHPIIAQLLTEREMEVPVRLRDSLITKPAKNKFPLLEISFNKDLNVEQLLAYIHQENMIYKLYRVENGQPGVNGFGRAQLHIQTDEMQTEVLLGYLEKYGVKYKIKGYAG